MENVFDIETRATISSQQKGNNRHSSESSISNQLGMLCSESTGIEPAPRDGSLAYEALYFSRACFIHFAKGSREMGCRSIYI